MNVGRAWPPRALRKTLERNIPRFAALSNPPLDAAQFSVENFSVGVPNHEEDVKRLERDHSDAEKNHKHRCAVRGTLGTLAVDTRLMRA
jgi:hypothetical protein